MKPIFLDILIVEDEWGFEEIKNGLHNVILKDFGWFWAISLKDFLEGVNSNLEGVMDSTEEEK